MIPQMKAITFSGRVIVTVSMVVVGAIATEVGCIMFSYKKVNQSIIKNQNKYLLLF
jgi:hypothetical protein